MTRFEHDPESGAWYVRLKEGEMEETIPLAEPGFGASVDVDREGYVLGVEFLSLEEFTELVARFGGSLGPPERVGQTGHPLSWGARRYRVAPRPARGAVDGAH